MNYSPRARCVVYVEFRLSKSKSLMSNNLDKDSSVNVILTVFAFSGLQAIHACSGQETFGTRVHHNHFPV